MGQKEGMSEQEMKKVNKPSPVGYSRLFLFLIIVAGIVYLIVSKFDVVGNIVLVLIGFGGMILIHEFGHFIIAKLSDIKVEAFSIGFPPVLAGIKRTAEGMRVRILPELLKSKDGECGESAQEGAEEQKTEEGDREGESNEKDQGEEDEGRLNFTFGSKGKEGETEYRIGIIPVGGFVKMLGQEDVGSAEKSDDPRDYRNKSVGVRMAVISAGVVFNVLSAALVFMLVFSVGIRMVPAVAGGVKPGSPAEKAGIQSGDEIIEIGGRDKNLEFRDIQMTAALSDEGENVPLVVRHEDGSVERYELLAEEGVYGGQLSSLRLFGILPPQKLTISGVTNPKQLYESTGLRPGDEIKSVNGREVESHWEFEKLIRETIAESVTVGVERSGAAELVELEFPLEYGAAFKKGEGVRGLCHIFSMVPLLKVLEVLDFVEYAEGSGELKAGDVIAAAGEVDYPLYTEFRDVTEESEDEELRLQVLRSGDSGSEKVTVRVIPQSQDGEVVIGITTALDMGGAVTAGTIEVEGFGKLEIPAGAKITAVGGESLESFCEVAGKIRKHSGRNVKIDYLKKEGGQGSVSFEVSDVEELITVKAFMGVMIPFRQLERLYKGSGPIDSMSMGLQTSKKYLVQAYLTLKQFFQGKMSPKNFMGPVGIVATSYKIVSEAPLIDYVYFLGLISTFIAVVNFLPVLPFDGGHIVFLAVEKIKGSPVSEKVQEKFLYAGWIVIGGFFLYLVWQDVFRIVKGVFI